jgi:stage II sporulation protein D
VAGKLLHHCRIRGRILTALLIICLGLTAGCHAGQRLVSGGRPMARRERPRTQVYEKAAVHKLRVQLLASQSRLDLRGGASFVLEAGGKRMTLPAGPLSLELLSATPARQQHCVFAQTFRPEETAAIEACMNDWRARGYAPETVLLGRQFKTRAGGVLDNRVVWISVARFPSLEEAEACRRRLAAEEHWAWLRVETVARGAGIVRLSQGGEVHAPFCIAGSAPVSVSSSEGTRDYAGVLEIEVGADGLLELYERLPLEQYLACVLPAEMPAAWPAEALKAQAVAARSEILANLDLKYKLLGFDYTDEVESRAYAGCGIRRSSTDHAVRATRGEVIIEGRRIVPAVFCSNAGGWTENNETVWSSPPDPALRGVPDFPDGENPAPAGLEQHGMARWLLRAPLAYSSGDSEYFRWRREYGIEELTRIVNQRHAVGTVRDIRLGERGVSGRLTAVTIVGTRDTVTVRKELPIRLAFGGLPSAMFILDVQRRGNAPIAYAFIGGGRGHGVGLCQHGARGMALSGASYGAILAHYFAGISIAEVQ